MVKMAKRPSPGSDGNDDAADCGPHPRAPESPRPPVADEAFVRAAAIFRAIGDVPRLRLLERLDRGEHCVTELAEMNGAKISTLSQQLRVLRAEKIVKQRREGKHIFYSLVDDHVRELIHAALEHASEPHAR
jgi:DNA-binding transcriptional ArsR family regulator